MNREILKNERMSIREGMIVEENGVQLSQSYELIEKDMITNDSERRSRSEGSFSELKRLKRSEIGEINIDHIGETV